MDNEIITTTKDSTEITNHAEIANSAKHKIRLSSSSSSSSSSSESSIDTIDKDLLVVETKQVVSTSEIDMDNTKHNHHNSSMGSSATNPTSTQMIVQGGAYDPNRIPASVFNSKPGTPMEWSVASNESLFSIHMGNTSFSRDHVFMLYRSGEIPKFDFDLPMNPVSGSNTPPIPPETTERKSEVNSNNSKLIVSDEEKVAAHEPELPASNTKSISLEPEKIVFPDHKSHGDEFRNSVSSTHSFQFPLLEVGGNSMKGAENLQSPKRGVNEQVEQQRANPQAQEEPKPQPPSAPPKRSTWLSFFSCCSAAN